MITTQELADALAQAIHDDPRVANNAVVAWVNENTNELIAVDLNIHTMTHPDGPRSPVLDRCFHVDALIQR